MQKLKIPSHDFPCSARLFYLHFPAFPTMADPTNLVTMEDSTPAISQKHRAQFRAAFLIQARKREKQPLAETPAELFHRLSAAKISKKIKSAKSAAKASIKKKETKAMTSYFAKKK